MNLYDGEIGDTSMIAILQLYQQPLVYSSPH